MTRLFEFIAGIAEHVLLFFASKSLPFATQYSQFLVRNTGARDWIQRLLINKATRICRLSRLMRVVNSCFRRQSKTGYEE